MVFVAMFSCLFPFLVVFPVGTSVGCRLYRCQAGEGKECEGEATEKRFVAQGEIQLGSLDFYCNFSTVFGQLFWLYLGFSNRTKSCTPPVFCQHCTTVALATLFVEPS